MSLLNLKSIFSPTTGDTKFQNNQSDLQNFDSIYDDGLVTPTQTSLTTFNTIFKSDIKNEFDLFLSNRVDNVNDTNLFNSPPQPPNRIFSSTNFTQTNLLNLETNSQSDSVLSRQADLQEKTEVFQSNRPFDKFDTKLDYNSFSSVQQTHNLIEIDLTKRSGREDPILDSLLRGRVYEPVRFSQNIVDRNLFVLPEIGPFTSERFKNETFDSRTTTPKEGTLYFNINNSFQQATNPTDFSSAGFQNPYIGGEPFTPLSQLGVQFYNGEGSSQNLSWESLYNSNHTPKDNPRWDGGGINALNYGNVNISRDNLNIGVNANLYGDRSGGLGSFGRNNEPYIVSGIGIDGREKNNGGFTTPFKRQTTDQDRILSFLESDEGLGFMVRQNALGATTKVQFLSKDGKLQSSPQRWRKGYNPVSTLAAVRSRLGGVPNPLVEKDEPRFGALLKKRRISLNEGNSIFAREYGTVVTINKKVGIEQGVTVPYSLEDTFENGSVQGPFNFEGLGKQLQNKLKSTLNNILGEPDTIKEKSSGGDRVTLTPIIAGNTLFEASKEVADDPRNITQTSNTLTVENFHNPDTAKHGMPLYFKDLRDGSYVFFRAYIEALTENITPTWTPHNYVGRSEPVYTYDMAERDINFGLKLVAHTEDELQMIYRKMNKLTSLCYPQYFDDNYGNRMKPPLTRFRLGDLYGKTDEELLGWIMAINYTVDQSATYEHKPGKRVPRYVLTNITYKVIHGQAPNLNTQFYGYIGEDAEDDSDANAGGFDVGTPGFGGNPTDATDAFL